MTNIWGLSSEVYDVCCRLPRVWACVEKLLCHVQKQVHISCGMKMWHLP